MKKITIMMFVITMVAGATIIISCSNAAEANTQIGNKETAFTKEQVKHGEYLVTTMGCDDCHSPKIFGPQGPEPDMSRRFSGHPADAKLPLADSMQLRSWVLFAPDLTAYIGPWGASFSANITSDETGIGRWI